MFARRSAAKESSSKKTVPRQRRSAESAKSNAPASSVLPSSEPSWSLSNISIFPATPSRPATTSGPRTLPTQIGAPADFLEQEADRAAEQVVRKTEANSPSVGLSRASTVSGIAAHRTDVPRVVHETLRSSGEPLDTTARSYFEPRFGRDFSAVRLHSDGTAAKAASSISARAFTSGHDIVLGKNAPNAISDAGRQLLAHELAHVVQQEQGEPAIQRQAERADVAAKAGEVESLVKGRDENGALGALKALDMADLLKVVERLYNDADAREQDEGKRRAFGLLNADLDPTSKGASPNPAARNLSEKERARLKAAFDAAPARKLRNPIGDDPGTSPTISGYRDRSKARGGAARPGDWGEDPAGNTWVAHADPVPGIRTYFGTDTPKGIRSSTWLGNNPSNADYVQELTQRAIGSFHWGKGVHHFAIYFSVADASSDLRERVKLYKTIGNYIRAHLGNNPKDKNNPTTYLSNIQRVVAVGENDPTSAWTADATKWSQLLEGFRAAEGWHEGKTITAGNIGSISGDAAVIAYYKNLLGIT